MLFLTADLSIVETQPLQQVLAQARANESCSSLLLHEIVPSLLFLASEHARLLINVWSLAAFACTCCMMALPASRSVTDQTCSKQKLHA